jgi:hypothetical protein
MRGPGSKTSFLFRLIVPVTAVFIVTVLALIAVLFGDQRAPLSRWLNDYGNTLLLVEFAVVLVLSFLAMAWDRWQILRSPKDTPTPSDSTSDH